MFTRLRIQNFKAWRDTGSLRLAPLTVFFGTNSSGKSSLLQFLLMLKQTVQSTDRKRVLNLGVEQNSLVNLGGWRDVVFRHEEQRTLRFDFDWEVVEFDERIMRHIQRPYLFEAQVSASGGERRILRVDCFQYDSPGRIGATYTKVGMFRVDEADYRVEIGGSSSGQVTPPPARFYVFPAEAFFSGVVTREYVDSLSLALERKLKSLRHLAPMRLRPERWYGWADAAPEDVGASGEWVVQALLAARERRVQFRDGTSSKLELGFEDLIARWLQKVGVLESFEIKRIAEHRQDYEVVVKVVGARDFVNLADVGFGVSLVLPVLVQLVYVEHGSTLLFEQPEIHLHPKAQSDLADVFIESIRCHEEGRPREIQLLVESHSEHFLRRLQRRIAEQVLKPEEVALYFCQPGPEGSTIEELKVDEYGRITNWPDNFFGDALGDTEQQMEVMLARMEQEEKNASK